MMTMSSTLPAQPVRQIFGSAFGAALLGGLLPLLMIAALFQA